MESPGKNKINGPPKKIVFKVFGSQSRSPIASVRIKEWSTYRFTTEVPRDDLKGFSIAHL